MPRKPICGEIRKFYNSPQTIIFTTNQHSLPQKKCALAEIKKIGLIFASEISNTQKNVQPNSKRQLRSPF